MPSLDQISARMKLKTSENDAKGRVARLPVILASASESLRSSVVGETPESSFATASSLVLLPFLVNSQAATLSCQPRSLPHPPITFGPHLSDCRERRAQDMLATLQRRCAPSECPANGHVTNVRSDRRRSAPPDPFPLWERHGFQHPALSIAGGF